MAAVTSGFVAVELPPGGGEAVVSDYAPLDQDTGANYDPDLGFDPAALVSLVLGDEGWWAQTSELLCGEGERGRAAVTGGLLWAGARDERRQVRPRRPVLGGHRPHAEGHGGREERAGRQALEARAQR